MQSQATAGTEGRPSASAISSMWTEPQSDVSVSRKASISGDSRRAHMSSLTSASQSRAACSTCSVQPCSDRPWGGHSCPVGGEAAYRYAPVRLRTADVTANTSGGHSNKVPNSLEQARRDSTNCRRVRRCGNGAGLTTGTPRSRLRALRRVTCRNGLLRIRTLRFLGEDRFKDLLELLSSLNVEQ